MKKLSIENLDDLAVGCAILGSGGGGDPAYLHMMARYEIEKNGPISLISPAEVPDEALVIPTGIIGAPLVSMERFPSGREYDSMFKVIESTMHRKVDIVMPFEIGGSSAFIPLIAATRHRLPVLDADMMGRAFPEAQMSSCHLTGVSPSPGFITGCLDETTVIYAKDSHHLEKIGRMITVAMGSSCKFAFYPLKGKQVHSSTILKSISKAIGIGKVHRRAKEEGKDPLEDILKYCKGTLLGSGKIIDIDRVISKGFLYGSASIQDNYDRIDLAFQNEFLVANMRERILATTPDIIALLEQETGTPVTSDSLQYGLKVNLIGLPAPAIWTSPEGLELVGPRHFGYEINYSPVKKSSKKNYSIDYNP